MSDINRNIAILNDTLRICEEGFCHKNGRSIPLQLTRPEMEQARVYLPEQVNALAKVEKDLNPAMLGECQVCCENMDSFTMALQRVRDPKTQTRVLVLNFANSVYPGGGVRKGSNAQEEDLCRRSSLLLSLESIAAQRYYRYHKSLKTRLSSGAFMISPQVEIFKDKDGLLLDESAVVSVVTFAAPNICHGMEGMTKDAYDSMVQERISNMLKCVAVLGYRHLVLGAWGCGAFKNNPKDIAGMFAKALRELQGRFISVDFAVYDRSPIKECYQIFAKNFGFGAPILKMPKMKRNREDRKMGCLIGGAVGDALGYPVEFWSEEQISAQFGSYGIRSYQRDRGTGKAVISDDTQMTMFTAAGLIQGDRFRLSGGPVEKRIKYVYKAYQDWLVTQKVSFEKREKWLSGRDGTGDVGLMEIPELYRSRAPGKTCLSALDFYRAGGRGPEDFIRTPVNNSKGCGGVMRVAPVGLESPDGDIEELDWEGAQAAAITHGHSLGYMPAAVLTHIIHRIVYPEKTMTLKEIVLEAKETAEKLFAEDENLPTLSSLIELAVELSGNMDNNLNNIHRLGEGWVAEEALAIAIYCSLRYQNSFSAGIVASVNHRGDSDSTGAITGNILGALIGYDEIEEGWKTGLELRDKILYLARELGY